MQVCSKWFKHQCYSGVRLPNFRLNAELNAIFHPNKFIIYLEAFS